MRAKTTKRARDIEKSYPKAHFVVKLRRLANAIETGSRFSIQVAGERLHVPAGATFNIEHERTGGAEELEFQIKWHAHQREAVGLKRLS
jgi:amphi-Trp domain-containing protein